MLRDPGRDMPARPGNVSSGTLQDSPEDESVSKGKMLGEVKEAWDKWRWSDRPDSL